MAVEPEDEQVNSKNLRGSLQQRDELFARAHWNLGKMNIYLGSAVTHSCRTLSQTIDNAEADGADIRNRALPGHEYLNTRCGHRYCGRMVCYKKGNNRNEYLSLLIR
jgi:hypothetical protein